MPVGHRRREEASPPRKRWRRKGRTGESPACARGKPSRMMRERCASRETKESSRGDERRIDSTSSGADKTRPHEDVLREASGHDTGVRSAWIPPSPPPHSGRVVPRNDQMGWGASGASTDTHREGPNEKRHMSTEPSRGQELRGSGDVLRIQNPRVRVGAKNGSALRNP